MASHGLSHQQRKELMEKGPFNLVFHGIKADWIEEEMADDEEFKRDVLEQKIRTLIREECELMRDVGIVDVYRHMEGAPLRGAFPVVVQFKARREKEQIMWRCKEKLRDSEIVVTEDSQSRLMALMNAEAEKIKKEESLRRTSSLSPKKQRRGGSQSPTKVPTSPVKKSNVINPFKDFSYSSEKPAHLSKNGGGFGGVPGSPTKSRKPSNGGGSLILGNKKGNEMKNKQSLAKSLFFSEGEEEEESEEDDDDDDAEETDVFPGDEEFEDHFDDLLDDFPAVPKSPEKAAITLPDSPQKGLFGDFMF